LGETPWGNRYREGVILHRRGKGVRLALDNGSRVGIIGGGPAGSFFAYFLMDMAERTGMDILVDIYEHRDFSRSGPPGCNMCGGVISETLVQMLATEGINLPPTVVQRGTDSYVMHMDVGTFRIETPLHEKRIAAVHRGSGPRGIKEMRWRSFDGYLQEQALGKGAHLIRAMVEGIEWKDGRPQIRTREGLIQLYDLAVVAAGINTSTLKIFENLGFGYRSPQGSRTYIGEFCLGQKVIEKCLGSSMHVFLLNIPRLEFAALIPKGDYVTVCLVGENIDKTLVESFLTSPEVKECLPAGWAIPADFCHCTPLMNVRGAVRPFANRIVFIGDSGVTRLYKDGIGAAYSTAKAAARTVVFEGISAKDFERSYWPACQALSSDNKFGKIIFAITRLVQRSRVARLGILLMVSKEQQSEVREESMSSVLWDTFSGSAPYRDIFMRTLHPGFICRQLWNTIRGLFLDLKMRMNAGIVR